MGTQSSKLPEFNDSMYSQPVKSVVLTEKIQNINGRKINVNRWTPEGTPKAVVVISHGLHEHGLRYHGVAEVLAREKYVVIAHDHVAHGLSEGTRGLITDYNMLVMDFVTLCKECHEEFPQLPFFVIAHSMGTLAAIMSVKELPFLKVCGIYRALYWT
jgi:alpha-beta hydrolase superfamily lysophospholipase